MRCSLVAVVIALAVTARADPAPHTGDPLVLAHGTWRARLTLEINFGRLAGREAVTPGEPLSLAPELAYGVTDRLQLAAIQGRRPLGLIDAGGGVCVNGCDDTLADAGVEATLLVRDTRCFDLAPRARVLVRDFDPAKPAVTLGALLRWRRGRFEITGDPYLRLGIANRDRGNRAALVVPVWLAVRSPGVGRVALHAGYDADLAVARDGWHGPLGVLVGVELGRSLELAIEGGFRSLYGPQNQVRERAMLITASWWSRR